MDQKRPVFEVMSWPSTELEHWSIFYAIDDKKEGYTPPVKTPDTITIDESKQSFRQLMRR